MIEELRRERQRNEEGPLTARIRSSSEEKQKSGEEQGPLVVKCGNLSEEKQKNNEEQRPLALKNRSSSEEGPLAARKMSLHEEKENNKEEPLTANHKSSSEESVVKGAGCAATSGGKEDKPEIRTKDNHQEEMNGDQQKTTNWADVKRYVEKEGVGDVETEAANGEEENLIRETIATSDTVYR